MLPSSHSKPYRSAGFTLVEIMVGMVVALLGIIVVMQVYSLFEGQRRTTSGSDDAMTSGAIALYGLQRDIRQAGYGFSDVNLVGCSITLPSGGNIALAPVTINPATSVVPAGDANTDTLLIAYGNSNGSVEGDGITSQPGTSIYAVQTPTSFSANDYIVAKPQVRPNPCNLALDRVANVASPNVTAASGVAGMTSGSLFNLGQTPRVMAYAIRSGNLTVCDYMTGDCGDAAQTGNSAIWVPIADNIVSLRADYGHDSSGTMDAIVDTYDQTTPATACNWARTSAVRVALVARSAQSGGGTVTAAAPTWLGTANATPIAIDLSATTVPTGLTWQNYRYKIFQTTVPLRNITALGVPTGC